MVCGISGFDFEKNIVEFDMDVKNPIDLAAIAKKCRCGGITSGAWIGADYSDDEKEFLLAIEMYKEKYRRPWPTWIEVLAVVKNLGYRKNERID